MSEIIVECGVAETRGARLVDGESTDLWTGPAPGQEGVDSIWRKGDLACGRITAVHGDQLFVDLGQGRVGYLNTPLSAPPEGALINVVVKRPAFADKSVSLNFQGLARQSAKIGAMAPPAPAPLQALRDLEFDPGTETIKLDLWARRQLEASAASDIISGRIEAKTIETPHAFDIWFEQLFARQLPLAGGGAITIDENEALTAIDVDSGAARTRNEREVSKVNIAASNAISSELRRRRIGGLVVIDFLRMRRDQRSMVVSALHSRRLAPQHLDWSKNGLLSFSLPRTGPSFLDMACETGVDDPIPGRRYSLGWRAKSLLRRLERRLATDLSVRFACSLGDELSAYIDAREDWRDGLIARHGDRVQFITDANKESRSYEFSEQ